MKVQHRPLLNSSIRGTTKSCCESSLSLSLSLPLSPCPPPLLLPPNIRIRIWIRISGYPDPTLDADLKRWIRMIRIFGYRHYPDPNSSTMDGTEKLFYINITRDDVETTIAVSVWVIFFLHDS